MNREVKFLNRSFSYEIKNQATLKPSSFHDWFPFARLISRYYTSNALINCKFGGFEFSAEKKEKEFQALIISNHSSASMDITFIIIHYYKNRMSVILAFTQTLKRLS